MKLDPTSSLKKDLLLLIEFPSPTCFTGEVCPLCYGNITPTKDLLAPPMVIFNGAKQSNRPISKISTAMILNPEEFVMKLTFNTGHSHFEM